MIFQIRTIITCVNIHLLPIHWTACAQYWIKAHLDGKLLLSLSILIVTISEHNQ